MPTHTDQAKVLGNFFPRAPGSQRLRQAYLLIWSVPRGLAQGPQAQSQVVELGSGSRQFAPRAYITGPLH